MTYSSRGIESITEGRHSRRSETSCHVRHIFTLILEAMGGGGADYDDRKWGKATKPQNPSSGTFLPAGLSL